MKLMLTLIAGIAVSCGGARATPGGQATHATPGGPANGLTKAEIATVKQCIKGFETYRGAGKSRPTPSSIFHFAADCLPTCTNDPRAALDQGHHKVMADTASSCLPPDSKWPARDIAQLISDTLVGYRVRGASSHPQLFQRLSQAATGQTFPLAPSATGLVPRPKMRWKAPTRARSSPYPHPRYPLQRILSPSSPAMG